MCQNVLQHNPLLCCPFSCSVCCKHTNLVKIRFTLLQVELCSFRRGNTVTWEELLVVDYDSGVLRDFSLFLKDTFFFHPEHFFI